MFEGFWHLLLFGLPTAQNGTRGSQDGPKSAQKASKMVPGRPKRPQKLPPKRTPRRSQMAAKTAKMDQDGLQDTSKTAKMAPRCP